MQGKVEKKGIDSIAMMGRTNNHLLESINMASMKRSFCTSLLLKTKFNFILLKKSQSPLL